MSYAQMVRCVQAVLGCSLLSLLVGFGSFVHAQVSDQEREPALVWTISDEKLDWGPCPEFLPTGCGIAVLHGDPSRNNLDVFFRLPANSKLPLHWHTSAERMVLVAGELHVAYEGQEMTVLTPGSYAYGPAKRPHDGACVSPVPCILFIAFESPLDAVPVESKKE